MVKWKIVFVNGSGGFNQAQQWTLRSRCSYFQDRIGYVPIRKTNGGMYSQFCFLYHGSPMGISVGLKL